MLNRYSNKTIIFVISFVAMFTLSCGGGGASDSTNVIPPEPTTEPPPDVIPPDFPIPRGIISTSGNRVSIPQEIIDNPSVSGFLVLDSWKNIQPQEGVYDWSHIDSEVERAVTADKIVRLALHIGGDSVPDWVTSNHPEIKTIFSYNKVTGDKFWFPAYWDDAYLDIKTHFYQVLGERYKNTPVIFAISASMADPNTGDWSFRVQDAEQYQAVIDAGFTEEGFIAAYKRIIDSGMGAFDNKYVVTAVGGLPNYLVVQGDVAERNYAVIQVLDYAFEQYGDRLIIAKGSLHARTPNPIDLLTNENTDLTVLNDWEYMWRYKPQGAGQFVWSFSSDPEFKMNGGTPYHQAEIPTLFDELLERSDAYELNWIEPWKADLLNEDFTERFAQIALAYQ